MKCLRFCRFERFGAPTLTGIGYGRCSTLQQALAAAAEAAASSSGVSFSVESSSKALVRPSSESPGGAAAKPGRAPASRGSGDPLDMFRSSDPLIFRSSGGEEEMFRVLPKSASQRGDEENEERGWILRRQPRDPRCMEPLWAGRLAPRPGPTRLLGENEMCCIVQQ